MLLRLFTQANRLAILISVLFLVYLFTFPLLNQCVGGASRIEDGILGHVGSFLDLVLPSSLGAGHLKRTNVENYKFAEGEYIADSIPKETLGRTTEPAAVHDSSYSPNSPNPLNSPKTLSQILIVANVNQEGVTKVLHEGKFGTLQNIFNDYYYKFVYAVNVHWTRFFHFGALVFVSRLFGRFSSPIDPIYSLFVGDFFSSPHIFDEHYRDQAGRWNRIFPSHVDVMKVNVTGDSDIGYGYSVSPYKLKRFETEFGEQNTVLDINNIRFVLPLAVTLDGGDYQLMNETWTFLNRIASEKRSGPLVLVSHIPLYMGAGADTPIEQKQDVDNSDHQDNIDNIDKPETVDYYESLFPQESEYASSASENHFAKRIPRNKREMFTEFVVEMLRTPSRDGNRCEPFQIDRAHDGLVTHQTHITKTTTEKILQLLKPDLVISSHDHIGCKFTHTWKQGDKVFQVDEIVQRSLQGDFGGHIGHLSISSSGGPNGQMSYHYKTCGFIHTKRLIAISAFAAITLLSNAFIMMILCLCCKCTKVVKTKKEKQD